MLKQTILDAANDPKELERLYRKAPGPFSKALALALETVPDHLLLQAWHERLSPVEPPVSHPEAPPNPTIRSELGLALGLAIVATGIAKLPHFISNLPAERFYPPNLPAIAGIMFLTFFAVQRNVRPLSTCALIATIVGVAVYLNFLPNPYQSDTSTLAMAHAPFFYWSLIGVAFLGGAWGQRSGRMDYLRFNGKLLIHHTIIMTGGMVLTAVTIAMFSLLNLRIDEWYMQNIGLFGALAAPLVATLLITRVIKDRFRLAPLLAKTFSPLFLVMVSVYLITILVNRQSPFTDRGFLIAFNLLMGLVLGMSILSISERKPDQPINVFDSINLGLVAITLLVDMIALAAILFRLSSYGFTPNRIAVLGANLIVFCHLAGILYHYACFIKKRGKLITVETWIVRFLPLYSLWSLTVIIILPLLFGFA